MVLSSRLLGGALVAAVLLPLANVQASEIEINWNDLMKADEEQAIDELVIGADTLFRSKVDRMPGIAFGTINGDDVINPTIPGGGLGGGTDPWEPLPQDPLTPGDGTIPGWDDSLMPGLGFSQKNGGAEWVALEVLFQTLNFYGVVHYVEKNGSVINFKIMQSKSGYFKDLNKLDVAYAVREFGRYLKAALCNNPSMENFYRMFAQVPPEEIGLRFKYDMAWALLGNALPKDPNEIMKLSTRWQTLNQVLNSTSFSKSEDPAQAKEYRSWVSYMSDIVKMLSGLNKLTCLVDVRPIPREELKKRFVISKMLEFGKRMNERYAPFKEILDQAKKEGQQAQIASLRQN